MSAPPKPKTCRKTSALAPSAAANDSTTVATSSSGASTARSSTARITSTTSQHDRDDQVPVVRGGALHVQVDRGAAADHGVGARHRVHGVAHPVTVAYAAWLSGGSVSVASR